MLTGVAAAVFAVLIALAPAAAPRSAPASPAPPATTDVLRGVRYVAYGHSFGQVNPGTGSTPSTLYPALVREALGADPSRWANRTVRGATTSAILARAKATWHRGDSGLVTFLGNQNDVGQHVPEGTFRANVRAFIDWVRGPGPFPPTVVVVLDTPSTAVGYARYPNPPTDDDVARYNRALREVVATYPQDGSVLVADASAGWDTTTMTSPDGQHPNDRGQAHIADAIETALAGVVPREGQNDGVTLPAPIDDRVGAFDHPVRAQ